MPGAGVNHLKNIPTEGIFFPHAHISGGGNQLESHNRPNNQQLFGNKETQMPGSF